jgi:hypothetical protein
MGGWLDGWAKRAAQASPAVESDVAPRVDSSGGSASASSRRDFLKKAGIVGGIAWSVPVMQTVMAPAASASLNTALGGNCDGSPPNSGPGSSCAAGNAICSPLNVCGGVGASCAGGKACFSSNCSGAAGPQQNVCGGTRATCTADSQCSSGKYCDSGVCKADVGGSCTVGTNSDCLSGVCSGAGVCQAAALGSPCRSNAGCANSGGSNINCSPASGFLRPYTCGGQGAVCSASDDCSAGSGNRCTGNNPSTCKA